MAPPNGSVCNLPLNIELFITGSRDSPLKVNSLTGVPSNKSKTKHPDTVAAEMLMLMLVLMLNPGFTGSISVSALWGDLNGKLLTCQFPQILTRPKGKGTALKGSRGPPGSDISRGRPSARFMAAASHVH